MLVPLCIIAGLALALIPHILWFIGWIGCRIVGVNLPYSYFGIATLVILIIFWSTLAYGYFIGRWKIESKSIEYAHNDIPEAFDGFKIVHISDLHLSTFDDSPERFNTFIEEINRHCPDLVCFTGDMVTVGRSEAEPYTHILKNISSEYGVLSVLGNHDFMIYGFDPDSDKEKAVEELAAYQKDVLGWKLLRNESHVIEAEVIPETDIPLTLSGHTHSAQIKFFGWTPAKWSFKEIAGRYDNGDQTLYINVGIGCTAPFRLGVNPEVTVITLRAL